MQLTQKVDLHWHCNVQHLRSPQVWQWNVSILSLFLIELTNWWHSLWEIQPEQSFEILKIKLEFPIFLSKHSNFESFLNKAIRHVKVAIRHMWRVTTTLYNVRPFFIRPSDNLWCNLFIRPLCIELP